MKNKKTEWANENYDVLLRDITDLIKNLEQRVSELYGNQKILIEYDFDISKYEDVSEGKHQFTKSDLLLSMSGNIWL